MPSSTIASTLVCIACLQENGTSAGDVSYELHSFRSINDSLSAGSVVSADSFACYYCDEYHEPDDFVDPYLANNRRIQQNSKHTKSSVRTVVTASIEDDHDDDIFTSDSDDNSFQLADVLSLERGFPKFLEIPIKSFETVKCNDLEPQQQIRELSPTQRKRVHERCHWNKIVSNRIKHFGGVTHLRVAEGLMLLGNAHTNCDEYEEALKVYRSAVRIFRKLYGDDHLTVARSLDKVGLVCGRLHDDEHLKLALLALSEAFSIRYERLGPIHVDTVETLNTMAGVYMHRREYGHSRDAYMEVYTVRQIVFGPAHPSVAVTAHALGSIHLKLAQLDDAKRFYTRALSIYKGMQLKMEHTTMQRLINDMVALDRVVGSAAAGRCKAHIVQTKESRQISSESI